MYNTLRNIVKEYLVAIYIRLSKEDDNLGESESIQNQKILLTKYVKEQGYTLVDIYIDDGYTGTNFNRPGFRRLLQDMKNKKINCIIVKDLSRFHNAGYKGLYNGETADDIFKRKKLRYREDILDNMRSEELADNIFRIAQTNAKLKRDNVDNEYTANFVHYEVGRENKNSIKRLGGTMPEDLPTPEKSLKEIEKENKKIGYEKL